MTMVHREASIGWFSWSIQMYVHASTLWADKRISSVVCSTCYSVRGFNFDMIHIDEKFEFTNQEKVRKENSQQIMGLNWNWKKSVWNWSSKLLSHFSCWNFWIEFHFNCHFFPLFFFNFLLLHVKRWLWILQSDGNLDFDRGPYKKLRTKSVPYLYFFVVFYFLKKYFFLYITLKN